MTVVLRSKNVITCGCDEHSLINQKRRARI